MTQKITRRTFLTQSAGAGAALWMTSKAAFSWPSEKLNMASIGVGGRGWDDLNGVATQNIVAICDVDESANHLGRAAKKFPNAKTYTDWRKLLEQKDIDAVTVGTPDHTHAGPSVAALRLGKHVYCEKPLCHSVYEARLMTELATKNKLVTQMGNQGHALDAQRTVVEILHSGAIGAIREAHCWTDRPAGWWPQGVDRPKETPEVPKHVNWDLWLGPAPVRPYHSTYHPFRWRGWWDFGTGALGDMACHVMDAAFWGLKLGSPTTVETEGEPRMAETGPLWETIRFEFPARGGLAPVKLTWYDGKKGDKSNRPNPELVGAKEVASNGSIFIGEKGTLYIPDAYGSSYKLLPEDKFKEFKAPEATLPRVGGRHHEEFIEAIKGNGKTQSNFEYAGPFTESVLLGVVAFRAGKKLEWDGAKMKAKNCPEADQYIKREYRKGWEL